MAKILLVEDEQDNRDLVRFALELAEHEIVEASTGEDGLALARSFGPDVVLMDISLRGAIDGLEATRRLRADPLFDRVPILVLTANVLGRDRAQALEAGCDDFLTKPIMDLEEFTALVEHYALSGRSGEAGGG
jgi:two-component system, cell cycle response regulator DivK